LLLPSGLSHSGCPAVRRKIVQDDCSQTLTSSGCESLRSDFYPLSCCPADWLTGRPAFQPSRLSLSGIPAVPPSRCPAVRRSGHPADRRKGVRDGRSPTLTSSGCESLLSNHSPCFCRPAFSPSGFPAVPPSRCPAVRRSGLPAFRIPAFPHGRKAALNTPTNPLDIPDQTCHYALREGFVSRSKIWFA